VANWQAEIEGVALSLLVSAVPLQYQTHREKVRHDIWDKSTLEPANVFLMLVAPVIGPKWAGQDQLRCVSVRAIG
jgi:hypothetical protein